MSASRQLLSIEDLTLLDAVESAPRDGFAGIARVFRDREVPFRPTTWSLIVDDEAEETAFLSDLATTAAATRSSKAVIRDDRRGPYVIAAVPGSSERTVDLLLTIPISDYRWRILERSVRSAVSGVSSHIVTQDQLDQLVEGLGDLDSVRVSRVTGRELRDGSSIFRGWRHDRPSYPEATREFRERPAAIRSVALWIDRNTHLQVRTTGGTTLYRGSVTLLQESVLRSLSGFAALHAATLRDRHRRTDQTPTSALQLSYGSAVFGAESATHELIESLKMQRSRGVAVLHGNPYLHAAVTDYDAASAADVFVTDDRTITIFPGYRSTKGFLASLAEDIAASLPYAGIEIIPTDVAIPTDELIGD